MGKWALPVKVPFEYQLLVKHCRRCDSSSAGFGNYGYEALEIQMICVDTVVVGILHSVKNHFIILGYMDKDYEATYIVHNHLDTDIVWQTAIIIYV